MHVQFYEKVPKLLSRVAVSLYTLTAIYDRCSFLHKLTEFITIFTLAILIGV